MDEAEPEEHLPDELLDLIPPGQLIVASSRGPYRHSKEPGGGRILRRSGGGLVTAMLCVAEQAGAHWICAPSTDEDRSVAGKGLVALPPERHLFDMEIVDIPQSTYDLAYNTISNPLLWFVQHYLWDLAREPSLDDSHKRAWELGYVPFNEAFAEAIAARCEGLDRPVVMLQDYHLYLVGEMIRARDCDASLVHFTHIPWPQPDYLRMLPSYVRTPILSGLLAADVVGFHDDRYVQNFLWCCRQLTDYEVDWEDRRVRTGAHWAAVRSYPISIQQQTTQREARGPDAETRLRELRAIVGNRKAVVRVDRVDPAKNVLRGFEAYRQLLLSHPELRDKVCFLAMLCPSREGLPQYERYRREVEELAADINAKLGSESWRPIHLSIKDDHAESLAALRIYDVLLVNPVFDGMNLVAKEGPCVNEHDGVLILSENAGAYDEVNDACLGVNPFDLHETVEALSEALAMSAKARRDRATRLREIVLKNDSSKWLYHQLDDLAKATRSRSSRKRKMMSSGPLTR
ncbi:MAG: trehalose-6-phosphate synthase [Actinobacteria bacterium]|nr:MAG: trehalose-6-phosphate synthase [Actinomycetota bacterium]